MANVIYPKFKEGLISGGANVNLSSGTVKIDLIDTGAYTYSAAHEFRTTANVPTASIIATTSALGTKTFTNGVFDAADTSWATVTGVSCEALIIWIDTGLAATDRLVAYIDTATGLPVTPNGNNINLTFDSGANKIFAL